MTIGNVTPAAGLTGLVQSEQAQYTLFGPKSLSQTSQQFPVDQFPVFVSAYNLGISDTITVYQVVGSGSGTEASPFAPVYGPLVLNSKISKLRIDYPGRYYCVHTGPSSLGTFTVLAAPAAMTSDSLAGLAQALATVIANQGLTLNGAFPIVVSGSGIVSDPYITSFAIGSSTSLGTTGHTYYGVGATATAASSTALGSSASATAAGTTAVGGGATASFSASVAVGSGAIANGVNSTAIGAGSAATGGTAVGEGSNATAGDVAVGTGSSASGGTCVALGQNASASGPVAIAVGQNTTASANASIAIGSAANATAVAALCFGDGTAASGVRSMAFGSGATATHDDEIAFGSLAGVGNAFANTITVSAASTPTVPTQANQILLGNATHSQLVTAGSIIQGGAISASDERLKKNIVDEVKVLDKIEELSPVTFKWNRPQVELSKISINEDEFDKIQHGLIAQEVESVFPEFVEIVDRGAGPYKFVRYDRLITVLLAGIKELSKRVTDLENKNV